MEGVGARLGRSSTRYGPATVFTGPVRRWKKKWVHVSPSNKKDASSTAALNGGSPADGSNGSHLLLYKWTPLSQSSNGNGNGSGNGKSESNSPSDDSAAAVAEEPPRRKFKFVPIALLEEQKRETTENEDEDKVDEDAKPSENDTADSSEKKDDVEEKPDINDVPMEDNEEDGKIVRQDLNKSTLDLSLNLNAQDGDSENDQRADGSLEG